MPVHRGLANESSLVYHTFVQSYEKFLLEAVEKGYFDIVQTVLEEGADVNYRNEVRTVFFCDT